MRRVLPLSLFLLPLALVACGDGATPARTLTVRQALTSSPEAMEFEPPSARVDLFRDIARTSQQEAGRETSDRVLFPVIREGQLAAAPGLDVRADLLQAPDAVEAHVLLFDGGETWPQERRDSLQGLSEREAAELVARSLLTHWGIPPGDAVYVDRAAGAPYAAAWADGVLRLNPAFLYLAAAIAPLP
jgi:hypothetical protein